MRKAHQVFGIIFLFLYVVVALVCIVSMFTHEKTTTKFSAVETIQQDIQREVLIATKEFTGRVYDGYYENGKRVKGNFFKDDGKIYYANKDGVIQKEPFKARGITFYPNSETGVVANNTRMKVYNRGTYVVTDISDQKLQYYVDKKLVLSCNIMSGMKGWDTPLGLYKVGKRKQKDIWIDGPTWHKHVDYWIPFIGQSHGFHDAQWQDEKLFEDKTAYKKDGSHGCIQMPIKMIAKFYDMVSPGTYVYNQK